MKQFAVLLLALFAAPAFGQSTNVIRCKKNPGDLPSRTYIEGCSSSPCSLPQNENATFIMEFTPNITCVTLKTVVTICMYIGPICIPLTHDMGENANSCNFLQNTSCPVSQGQTVIYIFTMFIEPFYPAGTKVDVEISIINQDKVPVACVGLTVNIIEARSEPALQ